VVIILNGNRVQYDLSPQEIHKSHKFDSGEGIENQGGEMVPAATQRVLL
jgi:hypothetical protein